MEEQKTDTLAPVLTIYVNQAIDKDAAQKALATLQNGYNGSLEILNGITEVTAENRESVVATLATIKKYYDKIKATREPITKFLDEMKKELMRYERPSDYNNNDSLYSQKRALVEAFDEEVRKEADRKKQLAEKEKQITVHLAELKSVIQRSLTQMMDGRKRLVIDNMAKWEKGLTLENLESSEKALVGKQPKLAEDEYLKRFDPKFIGFNKIVIIPNSRLEEMAKEATEGQMGPDKWKEWLAKENEAEYARFFEEVKTSETYDKYNEEYVRMVSEQVNALRARIPEIKKDLQFNSDRSAEIDKKAEELKTQVSEQTEQKLDEVTHEKDMNVMEAEFTQQAITQDLETGPTEKKVQFEQGQFLKPFAEIIGHCVSHPDFPGIYKKGKEEFVDGVKFWVSFYEKKCLDKNVKGIKIVEKAKVTIKAQ